MSRGPSVTISLSSEERATLQNAARAASRTPANLAWLLLTEVLEAYGRLGLGEDRFRELLKALDRPGDAGGEGRLEEELRAAVAAVKEAEVSLLRAQQARKDEIAGRAVARAKRLIEIRRLQVPLEGGRK